MSAITNGTADRIKEGDYVEVYFNDHGPNRFNGTVLHMAQATGECWIVREEYTGSLHYLQNFAQIVKRPKV